MPPRALQDQVRPQIGFGEQREIWLPVVEEAAHEARRVEWYELVDHAFRQSLLRDLCRGQRAGGDQHVEALPMDAVDKREDGGELADAGAVDPHQRSAWPRHVRETAALADARGMLLAALEAASEPQRRQRRQRCREKRIGCE